MSLTVEKEELVKRINEERDSSVIHAINDLLDVIHDEALEKELEIALLEADNGKGISHEVVWNEIKNRYHV
jgi:hypothetical protein